MPGAKRPLFFFRGWFISVYGGVYMDFVCCMKFVLAGATGIMCIGTGNIHGIVVGIIMLLLLLVGLVGAIGIDKGVINEDNLFDAMVDEDSNYTDIF